MGLSEQQCYELIKDLIAFPFPQICVNLAATKVLRQMRAAGMHIDAQFEEDVTLSGGMADALDYIRERFDVREDSSQGGE